MFAIIVRRTVNGTSRDWANDTDAEISVAEAGGCAAIRVLRGLEGRRDLFVISDWVTREAARRFVRQRATSDTSLIESADGLELRSNPDIGGPPAFHLVLLEEDSAVNR